MTYFVGHGGQVTVNNPDGVSLSVTVTGPAAAYSDEARSSSVSFPDTITATKTYYFAVNDDAVFSVKRAGTEIAYTGNATRTVGVREGKALSFTPDFEKTGNISSDDANNIVVLTQAEYDALDPVDANTLYVVVG